MRLTVELAQAFVNLRTSGDFKVFLDALQEDEREETQRALTSEGPTCHRAQGAALHCQLLLSIFRQAPIALEKFKQNPPKRVDA